MSQLLPLLVISLLLTLTPLMAAEAPDDAAEWTIYVANDNCPDYTWGLTEEQTRKAFADIVRGHLDEMKRTDNEPPENRDRYNAAVTHEAICFVEHYPDRKDELIRRIKEGRLFVSPYLCNSLWGFQSVEGVIRTFYPARRLEREWGIPMDVAEHIEEPSLPWGTASILAGCGIRWLSNPFYSYDSTFGGLKNPPVFILEGPDGSQLRVVMDPWASNRSSYTQGANLLGNTKAVLTDWLPHYRKLGDAYPLRVILASGTHGDINPASGGQARGFAEKIIAHNKQPGPRPKLVNATLPQFCTAVDDAKAKLPTLRGCFGHSWDVWPVCLAKTVADLREGERQFLAAEALLAPAVSKKRELREATRADRERAEWCLAMLSDHAWNGTDERNKRHNADLRRKWADELLALSRKLIETARFGGPIPKEDEAFVTLFNPMCYPRADLVRLEPPGDMKVEGSQQVDEDGRRVLYFVSPRLEGLTLYPPFPEAKPASRAERLRASPTELESPFYRLKVDARTGGVASLIHKATATELLAGTKGRTLCQTVYFDGQEHALTDVKSEVAAQGHVLARLRITGTTAGIRVTNHVTIYAELDRVDFDMRIHKPVTTKQERLCHVFPVLRDGATLRIETTGAVIRPKPQPEGDLLPGADTRRFAVQGFIDASTSDLGVTIAPLDAFVLRTDLDPITFEALGNDQNYREVVQDQGGVTDFRFRYSLRAHAGGYKGAEAFAWSRSVATPILVLKGRTPAGVAGRDHRFDVDPARAIVTCLKPADDPAAGGVILRLWETAGKSGPFTIGVEGYDVALRTDLLERDLDRLERTNPEKHTITRTGKVTLDLPAHGFAGLRFLP